MTRDKSPADSGRSPRSEAAGLSTGVASPPSGIRARRPDRDSRSTSTSLHPKRAFSDGGTPTASSRRRSSSFSNYSQDARDLLNPRPLGYGPSAHNYSGEALRHQHPTSSWDSLPLAFALLPAIGGLLVQGGSSFVTDLMLLCLGGIFLHWSVTQPWTWYHSAQQIREDHEASAAAEVALLSDTEEEEEEEGGDDRGGVRSASSTPLPSPTLEDVQEEATKDADADDDDDDDDDDKKKQSKTTPEDRVAAYNKKQRVHREQERRSARARQDSALRELYRHEVLALLACFAFPVLGAYLLHALRDQLTRPSEGLISNFNLTIFIMGAEVRPLRHLLQLVQARTLHLQRIVNANPYREEEEAYRERREQEEREQNQTLSDLVRRLDRLEETIRLPAHPPITTPTTPVKEDIKREKKKEREQLLREARAQLQPELDTLARALRRVHKQQALLENQVAVQFRTTDQRLNDTLSILAARQQRPPATSTVWLYVAGGWMAAQWVFASLTTLLLYIPRRLALCATTVAAFPVTVVQTVMGVEKTTPAEPARSITPDASGKNGWSVADRGPTIVGGSIRVKRPALNVRLSRDLDVDLAVFGR